MKRKPRNRDLDSPFYMEQTLYAADMAEYRENRENAYWRNPAIFKPPWIKRETR